MSSEPSPSDIAGADTAGDLNETAPAGGQAAIEQLPLTLVAYYSSKALKPGAFGKALRAAKVTSFSEEDMSEALGLLEEKDPTLSRTLALSSLGHEALVRWAFLTIRTWLSRQFSSQLSDALSDTNLGANELFERIVRACAPGLATRSKIERTRSENVIRLTLAWLSKDRNLGAMDIMSAISNAHIRQLGGSPAQSNRNVIRLLSRSNMGQLRNFSQVAALFETALSEARRMSREQEAATARFSGEILTLKTELQASHEESARIEEMSSLLRSEIAVTQTALREEKELRAIERKKARGRLRSFLSDRVIPALSDASDALDFDPPQLQAVRHRIDMARSAVSRELESDDG